MTQRPIKFRAWDGAEYHYSDKKGLEAFFANFDGDYDNSPREQFTGLTDKNGREIYEGDVLQMGFSETPDRRLVKYEDCAFWLHLIGETQSPLIWGNKKYPLNSEQEGYGAIEVIGNIYENPGLLEQA